MNHMNLSKAFLCDI